MKLQDIFNAWARSVSNKYAQKQWLLSKWEMVEGVEWPPEKYEIMLRSITEGLGLKASDTLVDLGCGGGWILKDLQARAKSAFGLDFSIAMLGSARTLFAGSVLTCGEIGRIPFKQETFDCALSYYVFINFSGNDDVEKSILEIMRILKRGGRALIGQLPDACGSEGYDRAKKEYFQFCREAYVLGKNSREINKPPLKLFDKEQLAVFLKNNGIRYEFTNSFNPFYREGEPERVDWRFDLLLKKN